MSAKAAKAKRRAQNSFLTTESNSDWTPLIPGRVKSESIAYDPALHGECFLNNLYVVMRNVVDDTFIHLSIRRIDRQTAHDWRDFQRIKNELAGPEWEAIEIYPPESELVDTANQYHLWCFSTRIGVGFQNGRCVTDKIVISGSKQRPLPNDWIQSSPDELLSLYKEVMAESGKPVDHITLSDLTPSEPYALLDPQKQP